MEENELQLRLFRFAVDVIKMLRGLQDSSDLRSIKYQLTKSSGSVGANYEEAQAAESRPDFSHKVSISLKEIRESNYWLRVLNEVLPNNTTIRCLVKESEELKLILGNICKKVRTS